VVVALMQEVICDMASGSWPGRWIDQTGG